MTVWKAKDCVTYRYLFYVKRKAYRGNTGVCNRESAIEVEQAIRQRLHRRPSRQQVQTGLPAVLRDAESPSTEAFVELLLSMMRAESGRADDLCGFVYVVEALKTRAVKIGFARNIRRRLHNLQIGSPTPLKVRASLRASPRIERLLHWAFEPARMSGEWYRLTPELRLLIDRLAKSTPLAQIPNLSDPAVKGP